jgi:Spy/CpxP family protein refolding chaperone
MRMKAGFAGLCVLAWLSAVLPASATKPPDLGRTKFKDIAKYLNLTADQQAKIKPDVDRIQDIVKQADKQRGTPGFGGGGRTPVGGGRWGAPGGGGNQGGVQVGDFEERRARRQEWQKEITNRVEEVKSLLTPEQLEKFKAIQVPNVVAPPSRGGWR